MIILNIRKYKTEDKQQLVKICLLNADLEDDSKPIGKYIELMFCLYYIEKEPENCFVATDENDIPVGYVYGSSDFMKYKTDIQPYIEKIAEIENGKYLPDAEVEMYNHYIYYNDYPAHLHIDILENYRGGGTGSELIKNYCMNLKNKGINGVMLIVGSDNERGRNFYEKNGFVLLNDKPSGAAYGKKI